jgi:hypothetical protein
MTGEISYDLVLEDDMAFVEGSYRKQNGRWQVFIFSKAPIDYPDMTSGQWSSGVTGVVFRLPLSSNLNKLVVEQMLSEKLAVNGWREVKGPDSMQLR